MLVSSKEPSRAIADFRPQHERIPVLRHYVSHHSLVPQLTRSVPTPHLDGKHVVFGQVRSNKGLVRRIESLPTVSDKPNEPVVIAAAGVLSQEDIKKADEERKQAQEASAGEDIWEVGSIPNQYQTS